MNLKKYQVEIRLLHHKINCNTSVTVAADVVVAFMSMLLYHFLPLNVCDIRSASEIKYINLK